MELCSDLLLKVTGCPRHFQLQISTLWTNLMLDVMLIITSFATLDRLRLVLFLIILTRDGTEDYRFVINIDI